MKSSLRVFKLPQGQSSSTRRLTHCQAKFKSLHTMASASSLLVNSTRVSRTIGAQRVRTLSAFYRAIPFSLQINSGIQSCTLPYVISTFIISGRWTGITRFRCPFRILSYKVPILIPYSFHQTNAETFLLLVSQRELRIRICQFFLKDSTDRSVRLSLSLQSSRIPTVRIT